eukprot:COSAG01_NODE_479_length_16475_cov_4.851979_10_plen_158_part_00
MASTAGASATAGGDGSSADATAEDGTTKTSGASALNQLDESLSPMLRTRKFIVQWCGVNLAGRSAAMAVCAGDKLSRAQKKAFFRLADAAKVDPDVAVTMVRLSDGNGVTANELDALEKAAAKKLPTKQVRGFEEINAENAGPGAMSVILEVSSQQI